jgi:2,3-bisphosphoglycerate-independent phosphoglycerate mutase
MSIFGYDPARFHTGRAPIEAAALGLKLGPIRSPTGATWSPSTSNGTMVDFAGGHPTSDDAAPIIKALDEQLGGEVRFHAGVEYATSWWRRPAWVEANARPRTICPTKRRCTRQGPAGAPIAPADGRLA